MKTTIDMAREVDTVTKLLLDKKLPQGMDHDVFMWFLERFADLVRADERWEQSKRRGVLAFCPYTGKPRHPSDIASDPHGILILVPDQPLRGMKP
jgi:hypothetical protein